ncbi:MAG: hypothetical protein Q7R80_02920 [bacterium]|nr:hypothetical protein [bacterium]
MRGSYIYVQSASKPITLQAHLVLFAASRQLEQTRATAVALKTELFEGRVTTTWDRAVIGSIAGTCFRGELDIGSESIVVTYIVRDVDIAEALAIFDQHGGFWCDFSAPPADEDAPRQGDAAQVN